MSTELDVLRHAELQDKVVSLYARSTKISEIVKQTGLTKRQVEDMLVDFKRYALQDRVLREMSRETVIKTREHYDDIIQQLYSAIALAEDSGDYKSHMQGLKMLADVEKQRVDFMQKAGMLADNEIGQQLVEAEERHTILIEILKKIMKKYPNVGLEIQDELAQVSGEVTGVPSTRVD